MSKKSIVLVVLCVLIITGFTLCLAAASGKKNTELVLEVAKNMYILNGSDELNVYMREDNSAWGWTENYKLNGLSKMIRYDKNNHFRHTSVITDDMDYEYLETEDGSTKVMYSMKIEEPDDEEFIMPDSTIEIVDIRGFFELATSGMNMKVSNDRLNGRDCYVIKWREGSVQFIEKEKKIPMKIIYPDGDTCVYTIRYDVVTEDDVNKLDDSDFKMVSEDEFWEYLEND